MPSVLARLAGSGLVLLIACTESTTPTGSEAPPPAVPYLQIGDFATVGSAVLLVLDEDAIDNGSPPNFFSDSDVNDQLAGLGVREQLAFFAANVGATLDLYSGQVGDEGWFALTTIPAAWDAAGPTGDGALNLWSAGPGLGTPDAKGDREALLDKVPDVTPLRAAGLELLPGQQVCAVVWDGDISVNYDPLNASLKGATLGTVAFLVLEVNPLAGGSSSSLPRVTVQVLNAEEVCGGGGPIL